MPIPTKSYTVQLVKLRQNLVAYFNEGELQDLCFDMGEDYKSLPGASAADKARELVACCGKKRCTSDLIAKCRESRPNTSWDAIEEVVLVEEAQAFLKEGAFDKVVELLKEPRQRYSDNQDMERLHLEAVIGDLFAKAQVFLKQGAFDDAIERLKEACSSYPDNQDIKRLYAEAMYRQGEHLYKQNCLVEAQTILRKVIELETESKRAASLLAKVEQQLRPVPPPPVPVWRIIAAVAVLGVIVAIVIGLVRLTLPPKLTPTAPPALPTPIPVLVIDNLSNGAQVDVRQIVQGHYTEMPKGWRLWGMTRMDDGRYYLSLPTDVPAGDGKWSLEAYFGDRTQGIGVKYQYLVIAALVGSPTERALVNRPRGSSEPLPQEGLARSAPITVTRVGPLDSWYADYWVGKEMTGAVRFSEDIPKRYLFKDWGNGSPAEGIPGDNWSGRFVRRVNFPNNGLYRFYAERDDGVRVWLDDKLVIDAWTDGALAREAKTITLTQGYHEIAVDFYDIWQQAWLGFWYEGPESPLTPLPVSDSYWQVAYYPNREFKNDPTSYDYPRSDYLDLNWSDTRGVPIGSPWATEILTDNFSTHSTREVVFKEGIYQFEISGDDGVKLRIDDQVLFEEGEAWKNCTPCRVRVDLTEGKHVLGVEQWETVGNARVSLKWERVSPAWETFSNPYIVQAMAVDDQYVWTGSKGGLVRWDKHRLSSYDVLHPEDGVPDNQVAALFKDRNGTLWVGTGESYAQGGSGLGRYDGKWRTLTTKDGLCDNAVFDIFQDRDGSLWIGTGYGLNHYDERSGKWECYHSDDGPGSNYPSPIYRDRKGNLWVGAGGVGISVLQTNGIWKTYEFDEIGIKDQGGIGSVAEDARGNLWFGSRGGVARFDGQHWKTFKEGDGLPSDAVLALAADEVGNVWFGTPNGLARYNGTTWQTFTTTHGLASNSITGLVIDRDGVLWVGHDDGSGISSFDGKRWVSSPPPQGTSLPTRITTIYQDRDQRFWFGTGFPPTKSGDGVRTFDGNKWEAFSKPDCLEHGYIDVIFQDKDGNMWFGYDEAGGGVTYVDSKSCRTFTKSDGLAGNEVDDIVQDRDGNLWFATSDGGLSRYDGKSWQTFNTGNSKLPSNDLNRIYQERNGDFWFGTRENGAAHYDGKNWEVLTSKDGLASNWVTDIAEDSNGALWFGTGDGGISRYDPVKKEWQTFQRGTDSLLSNEVYAVRVDKSGWIWVGTSEGVNCYTGRRWLRYTPVDGLASRHVRVIWEDRQGNMWFGTGGGTSRLRFVTASGGN
jgi:ligand-binding sensor domain-containing protein/tetratricopeptide (TPR) repeat protein